nr:hypothetical protein BaRGS_004195 [Batillaria attramentaria]
MGTISAVVALRILVCGVVLVGRHHKENGRGRAAQDRCRYRVVVVGDGECGKTSLVRRYCSDRFSGDYTPTLFDTETISDTVDGKEIELVIQDTAGQEDLDRLRPPFYLNKDAVIICFAVDNPDSLHNVETLWAPEVKKYCGQAPIILTVISQKRLHLDR